MAPVSVPQENKPQQPLHSGREWRGVQWIAILGACASLSMQGLDDGDLGFRSWQMGGKQWAEFAIPGRSLPRAVLDAVPTWLVVWTSWVFTAVALSWALWEALKFPRHISMATSFDKLRCLAQFLGDLVCLPLYMVLPEEKPMLGYAKLARNYHILERCPSLKYFKQSALFRNPYLSFAALMFYDAAGTQTDAVRRELLEAPDGGIVALDWWEEGQQPGANKILFVGSTFTGDALPATTRGVCKHFTQRGWRCVVMVKRGCGLAMPNPQPKVGPHGQQPKPWCFSGLADIQLALDHIAGSFPDFPICGVGLSLGAGQLRNYVNSTGSSSKLSACVCADAAESWEESILSVDRRQPLISSALFWAARATMGFAPTPTENHEVQGGVMKLVCEYLAPAHGFAPSKDGASNYMRQCQPADPAGCRVPVLEMFSYNDILIDIKGIDDLRMLHRASPYIVTCATFWGTHIIRWQGWKLECWLSRAACEFLEAAIASGSEAPAAVL